MINPRKRDKTNIVLIGMPGSGKSTIGVILAKLMGREFIDTDVLIQTSQNRLLQEIIDSEGHMALRKIEETELLKLDCENHIIATGGSAAYGSDAMGRLKAGGIVVFLNADLETVKSRILNFDSRGLAKRPDQSFSDLFAERFPLYKKYADITIDCSNMTQDEVCETIISKLQNFNTPVHKYGDAPRAAP